MNAPSSEDHKSGPSQQTTGSGKAGQAEPAQPPPERRRDTGGLPARIHIEPWADELVERHGHDPRSAYVETFWLPILGPSTTWFLRRIATGFDTEPNGFHVNCSDLSRELGLGESLTRNSSFVRAIDRAVKFGMAQLHDDTLYVRKRVVGLADRQISRLPSRLRRFHDSWVAPTIGDSEYDQTVVRSRRLALTLLELGEDLSTTERQLHVWQFHPSVAFDAAHWAMQRHHHAALAAQAQLQESNELPVEPTADEQPCAAGT